MAKCANAPVGHYYVRSDNPTSDQCPTKKCDVQQGRGFVSGWANSSSTCPTQKCSDLVAFEAGYGYQAGTCARVQCTGAKRGEYYTTPGDCTNVGKCTNVVTGKYYTFGWSNSPSTCPLALCSDTLAAGLYMEGNCDVKECTNAPVGNYYTSSGSGPNNNCQYTACTNAEDGHYYTDGHRTTDTCPTKACNASVLSNGYHFRIDYEGSERCQLEPCPPKVGHYFNSPALVKKQCDSAMTPCTNPIEIGTKYTLPGSGEPLVKNSCPSTACPGLVGYYYTTARNCDDRAKCNELPGSMQRKSVYVPGINTSPNCTSKACPVPGLGQAYDAEQVSDPCAILNCTVQAGYIFKNKGDCSVTQCPSEWLKAGQHFYADPSDPYGKPCQIKSCSTVNRGNSKFVQGFNNDSHNCQKQQCFGTGTTAPPCGFKSLTDCTENDCPTATSAEEPIRQTETTQLSATPSPTSPPNNTGGIVAAVVIPILLVVGVAVAYFLMRDRINNIFCGKDESEAESHDVEMASGTASEKIAREVSECNR